MRSSEHKENRNSSTLSTTNQEHLEQKAREGRRGERGKWSGRRTNEGRHPTCDEQTTKEEGEAHYDLLGTKRGRKHIPHPWGKSAMKEEMERKAETTPPQAQGGKAGTPWWRTPRKRLSD